MKKKNGSTLGKGNRISWVTAFSGATADDRSTTSEQMGLFLVVSHSLDGLPR